MAKGEEVPELEGVTRLERSDSQIGDPLTAEFVQAGREMIEEALQHDPQSNAPHPFLAYLSQKKVVGRVNGNGRRSTTTTVGALRDRWQPHSNYVRDLVDHIRKARVKESFPVRAAKDIRAALASDDKRSQLVRAIGRKLLVNVFDNDYFRLRLATLAALGAPKYRDLAEEESAVAFYREVDAAWEPLFQAYFDKYGLELRAGIHLNELVQMATAFGEGLALRELADPTGGKEREDRIRLYGNGLLALVLALTQPVGKRSMSIDRQVDAMA